VVIMEDISKGERILEYKLSGMADGKWQQLGNGFCIGHKRIEVIKEGIFSAIKLEVLKSDGTPIIKSLACY
jgi:alpha-L-fucosidase